MNLADFFAEELHSLPPPSKKLINFVTIPTQPQLNTKVGFGTKKTFHHPHHHHHHHQLTTHHRDHNVIHISAVTGPILTKILRLVSGINRNTMNKNKNNLNNNDTINDNNKKNNNVSVVTTRL